jgi:hypothetical protein
MRRAASIFEQAIRLSWLRGINSVSDSPARDLRDWLVEGTYSFQSAPKSKQYDIFVPDSGGLLEAYAFDANRMSCAAFESIVSIASIPTMRRSLAWLAIKSYYAAFYSAHAFIRLQGVSCTQLTNRETSQLASVAQAYGYGAAVNISSGFYSMFYDPNGKSLSFMNTGADGGGSHEILWFEFDKGLARLQAAIAASSFLFSEKTVLISKLTLVRKILCTAGCRRANWLSKVRNEITYRQSMGVWFPHRVANNVDRLLGIIHQYLSVDPLDNELDEAETLDGFIKLCLFVVNITRVTIIDMSILHPSERSFQDTGPMIVLRRARLLR